MARWYKAYPQWFMSGVVLVGIFVIILQSYIALPRPLFYLLSDTWVLVIIGLCLLFLIYINQTNYLLVLGSMYLLLAALVYGRLFGPPVYGMFFFLFGIWWIVDWLSYHYIGTSIFHELRNGNSRLALGIFLSTYAFGWLTELFNSTFNAWLYAVPFPSVSIWGIPALIATLGWTPWIMSILAIIYPFTQKDMPTKQANVLQ